MQERRKIAVAGATGRVGSHVVDVLGEAGHEVVPMSRSTGVDVVTGEGLSEALVGVDCIVDAASWPSNEQEPATEFFLAASRNLQEEGERAGVQRIVVVSIIGADRFTTGYIASKVPHEQAMQSGPIPVSILRAAQFHEFVPLFLEWGRQGDVIYVPEMRTPLVAARTVAAALASTTWGAPMAPASPPRYKLALVTWAGAYGMITLILWLLGPTMAGWPLVLRTLLISALMVNALTWFVLPA